MHDKFDDIYCYGLTTVGNVTGASMEQDVHDCASNLLFLVEHILDNVEQAGMHGGRLPQCC